MTNAFQRELFLRRRRADRIIRAARDLRSVHGENPEYDRALVELASDLLADLVVNSSREEIRTAILGD
jgi:hypothetical protein